MLLKKEHEQAFYLGLLLGELGFASGYQKAAQLVEHNLVSTKRVCRRSRTDCVLAFHLKAVLYCGDED